jgi:hypothetical protein
MSTALCVNLHQPGQRMLGQHLPPEQLHPHPPDAQQITEQLGLVGHGGLAHTQQLAQLVGAQVRRLGRVVLEVDVATVATTAAAQIPRLPRDSGEGRSRVVRYAPWGPGWMFCQWWGGGRPRVVGVSRPWSTSR